MEHTQATSSAPGVNGGEGTSLSSLAFVLAVGLIVLVGLALRLGDWRAVAEQGVKLPSDTREYLTIARQMKYFYWPSYREPLHPALIRAATWLVGPTERAPRLVSLTFSNLLVLTTALVGWRLFGKWPALAGSLFVAVHPYYLYRSTEGLRLELYSVLLLAFIWLLSGEEGGRLTVRIVLAGVVGGLLSLARMTSFVFVVPALIWCVLSHRKGRLRNISLAALAGLVLATLMVAPYLYVCHRYLGDSLIWINRHATWWHHRELDEAERADRSQTLQEAGSFDLTPEGKTRTDGRATRGAVSENGPAVRHRGAVTIWQYLFRGHSVTLLMARMLKGYGQIVWILGCIFATESLYARTHLVALVGWLGFVGLARSLWRGPRVPILVALLSLLPVSFVVPVGANFRLFLHVLPLWILWLAWGLAWPWELLAGRHKSEASTV